jgi:hypothetical protein
MVFSADETSDVGVKRGSPMSADMPPERSKFNGTVDAVVIDTEGDNVDHMLSREDVLNIGDSKPGGESLERTAPQENGRGRD